MNRDDYIKQVDSLEFSDDLESRIISATRSYCPKKKRRSYFFPVGTAAAALIVLAVLCAAHFLPNSAAKDMLYTKRYSANGAADENRVLYDAVPFCASEESKSELNFSPEFAYTGDTYGGYFDKYLLLLSDNGEKISDDVYMDVCNSLVSDGFDAYLTSLDNTSPAITLYLTDEEYVYLISEEDVEVGFVIIKE